jgi:ubiquitin carboxyl-terminal hydrolase 7
VKELLSEARTDLLKENLITREQCDDESNFRLRLVEIVGSRVHRIFREDIQIETLENAESSKNKSYRVERILAEEMALATGTALGNPGSDYLLPIAHFNKEVYATFGAPFLLKVKLGEPFKDIKARIQRRLDVPDKDFTTVFKIKKTI